MCFLLSLLMERALDWASAVWDQNPQVRSSITNFAGLLQSGWNNTVLLAVFQEGLCSSLQAEMACRDTNISLSSNITTAIRLDNLLLQYRGNSHPRLNGSSQEAAPRPQGLGPEPMQLGRISPEERQYHDRLRLCFYCSDQGHRVAEYP